MSGISTGWLMVIGLEPRDGIKSAAIESDTVGNVAPIKANVANCAVQVEQAASEGPQSDGDIEIVGEGEACPDLEISKALLQLGRDGKYLVH